MSTSPSQSTSDSTTTTNQPHLEYLSKRIKINEIDKKWSNIPSSTRTSINTLVFNSNSKIVPSKRTTTYANDLTNSLSRISKRIDTRIAKIKLPPVPQALKTTNNQINKTKLLPGWCFERDGDHGLESQTTLLNSIIAPQEQAVKNLRNQLRNQKELLEEEEQRLIDYTGNSNRLAEIITEKETEKLHPLLHNSNDIKELNTSDELIYQSHQRSLDSYQVIHDFNKPPPNFNPLSNDNLLKSNSRLSKRLDRLHSKTNIESLSNTYHSLNELQSSANLINGHKLHSRDQ